MTKVFSSIKGDGSKIPCVDKVLSQCFPISRRMIILLCHSPHLRELLGGFDETCQWISRSGRQVDQIFKSVSCLGGKCQLHPRSGEIWERERLAYFVSSKEYREIFDIAREPVVFEWRICPGHTHRSALRRSPEDGRREQSASVSCQGAHHFSCRCSVTLTGPTSTMKSNAGTKFIARIRFCRTRCWTLLGPADEEEWYGTLVVPTRRKSEQHCPNCDGIVCRERPPRVSLLKPIVQRILEK